jgi:hypothetical protein
VQSVLRAVWYSLFDCAPGGGNYAQKGQGLVISS